ESALLDTKDVNRIDYVRLASEPARMNLSVQGSKIVFDFSNLTYSARVRIALHGAAHTICGSNIWVKISGRVYANGEYDPLSGELDVGGIDLNESLSANCNRLPGRILDPAIDSFTKKMLKDEVKSLVRPILEQTVQLTPIQDLFPNSAIEAKNALGFDFIENGWKALSRYVEGLTMGVEVGIDQLGASSHMLKFYVYQNPVVFTESYYWQTEKVVENLGKWGSTTTTKNVRKVVTHFDCPIWAGTLNTYRIVPIKTREKIIK